jgi:S-sulfosulfanyl-L-cysteine sulfohydrolase
VGGLSYEIEPGAAMGSRISDLRLAGVPLDAAKTYKVAGWAPVAEGARDSDLKPVWELVETWLKDKKRITPRRLNTPRLVGVDRNPGLA